MNRSRVMSFVSSLGGNARTSPSPSHESSQPPGQPRDSSFGPPEKSFTAPTPQRESQVPRSRPERASTLRPLSMIGGYQPPLMEIAHDTIPELLPIFTFLNSHSNKLYQEGYFLKLNDLDTQGRVLADRSWTECFAQLVGTVLSLWDAAALDAAGQDGEIAPTFINLADASIKMIENLPTRGQDVQPLSNVLSICTAGKNRYLFHFSNVNALTQWTAGIRLAMYEHATLQEAYTGSLVAGKGRTLNNIKAIMERTRVKNEDWARVRFGAGTPWRRCWCVISPPDEKEVAKFNKAMRKKSAYDRTTPILKGDVNFYDTRKTKKAQPIATIRDSYSAYAIYPQSKPLIDQSTLIKIEGTVTIHSRPENTNEGFIFVMPEAHPAVTGFEIMLRFLFPLYDIFGLYGRPTRLIADTLDTRSLMFAMPTERRYGYLEIFDVATLIHTEGSESWSEKEWRKRLKLLTSERMAKIQSSGSRGSSRLGLRPGHRNSLPSRSGGLRFGDPASTRSTSSLHRDVGFAAHPHAESAPPGDGPFPPPRSSATHQRSISESTPSSPLRQRPGQDSNTASYTPTRLSYEANHSHGSIDEVGEDEQPAAPPPPPHGVPLASYHNPQVQRHTENFDGVNSRSSSDSDLTSKRPAPEVQAQSIQNGLAPTGTPAPVSTPPAFSHQPGEVPEQRPYGSPELRRANSRMSSTTLSQLAAASNPQSVTADGGASTPSLVAAAGAAAAWRANAAQKSESQSEERGQSGNTTHASAGNGVVGADHAFQNERTALASSSGNQISQHESPHLPPTSAQLLPPYSESPPASAGLLPPSAHSTRNNSPLSQSTSWNPADHAQDAQVPVRNFSRQKSIPQNKASHSPIRSAPTAAVESQRPPNPSRASTQSISRKPVGRANESVPAMASRPSAEEVRRRMTEEASLDRGNTARSHQSSDGEYNSRRPSENGSYYEDSQAFPDDHQDRGASVLQQPFDELDHADDRPRTGVLRTVGQPDPAENDVMIGDFRYRPDESPTAKSDIPNIDFGPTPAYKPAPELERARSDFSNHSGKSRERSAIDDGSRKYIKPNYEAFEHGYRSRTPEPINYRSPSTKLDQESRATRKWQPGTATVGTPGSTPGMTPEQYVQQRASAGRITPVYAHGPNASRSPPPGMARKASGDWSGQSSQPAPRRDVPTGPSPPIAPMRSEPPDYAAHLSAREQEHVARVTGSPLLNMSTNGPRQPVPSGGLIGAIEAREREKKDLQAGLSGQMVQHAIAQRQQQNHQQVQAQRQQQQQQLHQQQQQELQQKRQQQQQVQMQQLLQQQQQRVQYAHPNPSPAMHIPGQFPETPMTAYGFDGREYTEAEQQEIRQHAWHLQQQQQYAVHPSAAAYWGTSRSPGPQLQPHYPEQAPNGQQARYQQNGQHQEPQQGNYFGNVQGG